MHAHGNGTDDAPIGSGVRRAFAVAAVVLGIVTVAGIVLMLPRGDVPGRGATFGQLYDARVERIGRAACPGAEGAELECLVASVRLLEGPDEGRTVVVEVPDGDDHGELRVGSDVVVAHYENREALEAGVEYQFVERDRKPALAWLAVVFALAVVALGRLRGLAALVGLVASILVLLRFVLPAILDGRPPMAVAVVGAAAIAFVALYAAHGLTTRTTVALLGTLASLALTTLLGVLFTTLAEISGQVSEEAVILAFENVTVDLRGIFLAGLVIGALGALDDMTVTQTSAVWELSSADPAMTTADLFRAGMRIGRDHVASTVNTLVLAYAGASMTLLLLFVLSERSLAQIANGEIVAVEIVRTLVGSIGLVASVPITTWLATVAVRAGRSAS